MDTDIRQQLMLEHLHLLASQETMMASMKKAVHQERMEVAISISQE
jgi:hypothetical protein